MYIHFTCIIYALSFQIKKIRKIVSTGFKFYNKNRKSDYKGISIMKKKIIVQVFIVFGLRFLLS